MKAIEPIKAIVGYLIGAINIALFFILIYRWFLSETIDSPPMARSDYIDLLLTLLGIMMAVVMVFLAVAAFFAYYDIRQAASRMAEKATLEVFQSLSQKGYLERDGYQISVNSRATDSVTGDARSSDPITYGNGAHKGEEGGDV